jgi:hypothetical protein
MTFHNKLFKTTSIIALIITAFALVACSPEQDSTDPQAKAINEIRKALEIPALPLTYVETTTMVNSPDGGWEVAIYQDDAGRKYSVTPQTNHVVEIDARSLLQSIPSTMHSLSPNELKAKVMEYATATISDFDSLQASLQFEEGTKGDNYFFTWYAEMSSGSMNRQLVQIGLHKSGILFAYYNTLQLER